MSFLHCCLAFSSMRAVSQTDESCDPELPSSKLSTSRGRNFSSRWKSGRGPDDSNKASYLAKKKGFLTSQKSETALTSWRHRFHGWHRHSTG